MAQMGGGFLALWTCEKKEKENPQASTHYICLEVSLSLSLSGVIHAFALPYTPHDITQTLTGPSWPTLPQTLTL